MVGRSAAIGSSAAIAASASACVLQRHVEPLAAELVLELVGAALGDDVAAVDHGDAVGEAVGLVQVLGGEQHRGAVGDPAFDRLPEGDAAARVEPGGRLVEEEDRRPRDEGRGEVEAAAHPARVGADQAVGGVAEVEALQQLGGAGARLALGQVVEAADHLQVLGPGEVFVDRRVLAGEADLGPQLRRLAGDVEAGDAGAAAVGREQGGEDADRGRLAGAVGPEQAEHGAGGDPQVDPVERAHVAVGLAQSLSFYGELGRASGQPI